MEQKGYNMRVWLLLTLVVVTVAVSKSFGLRVDAEVLRGLEQERFDAWYGPAADDMLAQETIEEYVADFERLEEQLDNVTESRDTLPIHRWVVDDIKREKSQKMTLERLAVDNKASVVPVEVYRADSVANDFDNFINKLIWGEDVRIAFLGDSYVEGDILTSDLREALQERFGGRGVGFVHCDIPFTISRRTVTRKVSGWSAYSVLKPKNNPQTINDNFFVSGYTSRGTKGAKASWQTTSAFDHLDSCSCARIMVATESAGSVKVTLNGDAELVRQFDLVATTLPQQIYVEANVSKIEMEVVDGVVDCYGASIEGVGGVILDNFSMRANSGHAIFGTSAVVNRQIDDYLDYDLVVLQYGLNIMEATRSNYSSYGNKLQQMIAYAKSSFPNAAVLVLGVSDRWVKNEESGSYQPIGTVEALTSYQRGAAEATAVAFWPTADAMALYGGIPQFVENGWAAKDYTHINFAGGAQVARELCRAIVAYAHDHLASGVAKRPYTIDKAKPIGVNTSLGDTKPILKPVGIISNSSDEEVSQEVVESTPVESTPIESVIPVDVVEEEPILEPEGVVEPMEEMEQSSVEVVDESADVEHGESVIPAMEHHEVDVMDEAEFFEIT